MEVPLEFMSFSDSKSYLMTKASGNNVLKVWTYLRS